MPVLEFILRWQFLLGLLGAACLFVPWHQRRSFFPVRILLGTLAAFIILDRAPLELMWQTSLLLGAAVAFLLVWGCFDCSIVQALFTATCAYTVQHITSKLTYMVVIPLEFFGWPSVFLLLLCNLLVCVPIYLYFTKRFRKEHRLMFDNVSTVIYSGLFLFVAVFLSTVLENNLDPASGSYLESYLALNAFCVLFAIVILSIEFKNCSMKQLENEKMILEQLLESDKLQYEQAKKDMEKINIRYHDLKQQYSRADDEERAKLEAEISALNFRYYTDNKALDIVLTQKALVCEKARIQFVCSADGKCLSGMKHYHIYSLLGNAIDNAIECLSKVDDPEKKVIRLNISRYVDMAVVHIENYTPAPLTQRNGDYVTTKENPSGHGYGLKSIRNIAGLYSGTADCFVEDSVFCLLVTFPCRQPEARPDGDNSAI